MIAENLGSLLHHCSKLKALRHGLSLHAVGFKTGLIQSNVVTSNHVLNMYAKCGDISSARKLFDEMSDRRNLVTWSAMVSGYDQFGYPLLALDLFSQLHLHFVPNEYVFASALSSCASVLGLMEGQQIHAQALKFGYGSVSFVANSLITLYMKCCRCSQAFSVYGDVLEPNSVAYNALISGFAENQQPERGFEAFKLMHRQGFVPDRFTFVGAFGICTDMDDLKNGLVLHGQTVKLGLDSTSFIGNVIMTMYSKFNLIDSVERIFGLIGEKDVISWNTFISACSHCEDHEMGLRVFKEIWNRDRSTLDEFTFASALAACSGLASLRHGKQIHAKLVRTKLNKEVGVENALVNMYAKCGSIEHAYKLFEQMPDHNMVSWNTMIAGFGNHGLGTKALELFEQMKAMGIMPDPVTFIGVLTACNHSGLVDNGEFYFNSMQKEYGITPVIEHFSCLIDLLGRGGRLCRAEEYISKYSFGNDPVVLGSLLSACRLNGDLVIGERLAKRLLRLQPETTSPYVLLSNLYASDEMWDEVAEARKMLKGSGLKKEPGYSVIEVAGTFEKFTIGDFSHSRIEEIKDVLDTVRWAATLDTLLSKEIPLSAFKQKH